MTLDLISRAEARISEINQTVDTLCAERDEIEIAIRTLSRLVEPQPQPAAQSQGNLSAPDVSPDRRECDDDGQPIQPGTATQSTAARKDVPGVEGKAGVSPAPGLTLADVSEKFAPARDQVEPGADNQAPPVDTNSNSVSTEPPSPLTEAGEGGPSLPALPGDPSSETPEPVTLIDRIEQKPTLKQLVSACLDNHPDWTARQIAEGIGRPLTSVQTTLRAVRRERDAQTEPAEHHTLAAATIDEDNEPVDIPAVRRPRPVGERFYLRDRDGRFLHQAVTRDRDGAPLFIEKRIYGWFGTEANFQNVLKILPEVAGLRKEVPEK